MKKYVIFFLVLLCAAGVSAKELKVLMIGNSFSNSVKRYFPQVTAASGKHKLILGSASIGGCSLQRHCSNIDKEQKDPKFRPYRFTLTEGNITTSSNLVTALKYKKWDIVTIQQASAHSYKKELTLDYAAKLIAYIRKYAPQAEIVIQQTWAWRQDRCHSKKEKLNQEIMYKGLVENYNELARIHKLRIIPVGTAVQLYRQKLPVKQVSYTQEQIDALKKPAVLDLCGGDLVGWMRWIKNKKTGKEAPYNDAAHLNTKGAFLQGCIWYMVLFDEPASSIKLQFQDKNLPLLLQCAEEAVKQYKK